MYKNLFKSIALFISTTFLISCGPVDLLIINSALSNNENNRPSSRVTFDPETRALAASIGCSLSTIFSFLSIQKLKIEIEEEHLFDIAYPAINSIGKDIMSFYDNLTSEEYGIIMNYINEAYYKAKNKYSDIQDLGFYKRLFAKAIKSSHEYSINYPKTTCWKFSQRFKKRSTNGDVMLNEFGKLHLKIKGSSCSSRPEDSNPNDPYASAGTIRAAFCTR